MSKRHVLQIPFISRIIAWLKDWYEAYKIVGDLPSKRQFKDAIEDVYDGSYWYSCWSLKHQGATQKQTNAWCDFLHNQVHEITGRRGPLGCPLSPITYYLSSKEVRQLRVDLLTAMSTYDLAAVRRVLKEATLERID